MTPDIASDMAADLDRLVDLILNAERLVVLTGAGCSTESGIPDYRSPGGLWTNHKPIYYADFVRSATARQRYWARSMAGWHSFHRAAPNPAHRALSALEARGRVHGLITQNVDRLHQAAGSRAVIELHGHNDGVICLGCGMEMDRHGMQDAMEALNPTWSAQPVAIAPDGDAQLDTALVAGFRVPACGACGGMLKPNVVFFGESVPVERVARSTALVDEGDALLVAGSSLTVWSGYRFARQAAQAGKPLALVNIGPTRADPIATLKIEQRLGTFLPLLLDHVGPRTVARAG
ncbi:MAG TPA: NAD-dependent protein deacetylase [Chloroflexia bacterium]|nr:NAD-dependent protein deacetylase [Chloroflexia bacterium]